MDSEASTGNRARSLRSLFSYALLGQGVHALGQWALLVLITKTLEGPTASKAADMWIFALAFAGPFVLFTQADLRVLIASDADRRFADLSYRRARQLGNGVMAAAVLSIGWWAAPDEETWRVIAALAAARWVEGWHDLAYGHFQRAERQDWQAQSQGLRALLGVTLAAVTLHLSGRVDLMVTGVALAWLAVYLALDRRRLHAPVVLGEVPPASGEFTILLGMAAPLALTAAVISLNSNLPRYALEGLAPPGSLGIFGAVAYVLVALALINQALRSATLPRFAAHVRRGEDQAALRVLVATLLVAALPGALVALVASPWGGRLLVLLYNPEFADQGPLLLWLSLAAVAGGLAGCFRAALTALGVVRSQVFVTLVSALVTGLCAWMWVPHTPLLGAAWAVLAGRVSMLLLHGALVAWSWPRR